MDIQEVASRPLTEADIVKEEYKEETKV